MTTTSSSTSTIKKKQQQKHAAEVTATVKDFNADNYCHDLLEQSAKKNTLAFVDPNEGMDESAFIANTVHSPPFRIALHNKRYDPKRWKIKTQGYYYETDMERGWRKALQQNQQQQTNNNHDQQQHIIDIGGNIGYFSLLTMSLGVQQNYVVHYFEPNPTNQLRFCQSLQSNHWIHNSSTSTTTTKATPTTSSRALVYPVAVSDQVGVQSFWVPGRKPGEAELVHTSTTTTTKTITRPLKTNDSFQVQLVTLDDMARSWGWLPNNNNAKSPPPSIVILKIDVESFEPQVIQGAKQLLQQRWIRNIFMEVTIRTAQEKELYRDAIQFLVQAGYRLQGIGGILGPGNPVPWTDPTTWTDNILAEATIPKPSWLSKLIFTPKRTRLRNLWWTL